MVTDPCRPRIRPRVIHGKPLACGAVVLDRLLPLYYTNSVHGFAAQTSGQLIWFQLPVTQILLKYATKMRTELGTFWKRGLGMDIQFCTNAEQSRELSGPTSTQQRSNHRDSLVQNPSLPLAQAEHEFLSHFFWWHRKLVVRVLLLRLVVLVVVAIQQRLLHPHWNCVQLTTGTMVERHRVTMIIVGDSGAATLR